ncbi:hypothetical protein [Luteolibacter soli]|uniref:Uncharacterized protein n=1 Tax=Luteolibacter soli TaxID=3135280 RepID=A0ABU9AY84_9BACT
MKRLVFLAILFLALPRVAIAGEDEVEIYRSEEFTSPGADDNEVLHFVRVFTVNWGLWKQQPRAIPRAKPPLSAVKVLELAEASLDSSDISGSDNLHVTKLELRNQPSRDQAHPDIPVAFYVVTFHVNDNDILRAVLMDGTVLKPQLTKIPTEAKDKR